MITDRLGTDAQIDVTHECASVLSRVNPYYALADGRPLPIVLLEENAASAEARAWFRRWLAACSREQVEFCGALLFWAPREEIDPNLADRRLADQAGECWTSPQERDSSSVGQHPHGLVDVCADEFGKFRRIWNDDVGAWLNV